MQPDGLTDADALADGDRPLALVDPDERPHQEVAALVIGAVLVDDDADQETLGGERLLGCGQLVGDRLHHPVERRLAGQLLDHVLVGSGHDHLGADRRRALRHAAVHVDVLEREADRPHVRHLVVVEQRGRGCVGRSQAADNRHSRSRAGHLGQEGLGREGVGIDEHDDRAGALEVGGARDRQPAVADGDRLEVEGAGPAAPEGRGQHDDAAGLDLATGGDDAPRAAARQRTRLQAVVHGSQAVLGVDDVVAPGEDERQVAGRAVEGLGGVGGRARERVHPGLPLDQAGAEGDRHRAHASSSCPCGAGDGCGPGSWPISSRKRRAELGASAPRLLLKATCTSCASSARCLARPAISRSSSSE